MKELVEILFAWAVLFSPYDHVPEPQVEVVPHEFFVENVCGGKECKAVGWYNDTGIIYVDFRLKSPLLDKILVHEMVHYLQHMSGKFNSDSCEDSLIKEREAYRIQSKYAVDVLGVLPQPMNLKIRCGKKIGE